MEKKKSFEENLARLDKIAEQLETGDCPLDDALKLYTEGVGLIRLCSDALEKAEMSVKKLQLTPDGKAALVKFDDGEEDA